MIKVSRNNIKRHHNASDQLHEHKQNLKNGLASSSSTKVPEIPEAGDDIKAEIIETDDNEVATVTELDDPDESDPDEEIDNHDMKR